MVALLAEADRLAPMVELVGLQALPPRERMALLAGRLLRAAVLQQSALSVNDATCTPDKQAALVELVLAVYDRCVALVDQGVTSSVIEEADLSGVTRARDELKPDDATGVMHRRDEVLASLEGLA